MTVVLTDAEKASIAVPPGSDCQCCDCPECHMTWHSIEQVVNARVVAGKAEAWDEGHEYCDGICYGTDDHQNPYRAD